VSALDPVIAAAVEQLEAKSRDYETRAGACREAAAAIRRACGISTLGPKTIDSAPGVPAARASAPALRPARDFEIKPAAVSKRDVAVDHDARRDAVVNAVRSFDGPCRIGEIAKIVGRVIARATLVKYLRELVDDGRVVRTGERAGARYAPAAGTGWTLRPAAPRPEPVAKPTSAPEPVTRNSAPATTSAVPKPVVDAPIDRALLERLDVIFKSGASYDYRELIRNVRTKLPAIDEPQLVRALERLVTEKRVERLWGSNPPRYRVLSRSGKAQAIA
jgi:DNA-binding HxlR family transcriptional regulator